MQKVGRLLAVAVIVALLAVGALVFALDEIIEVAVEEGGTAALGVATELGSADLDLLGGKLGLAGLEIANPPGFASDPFFSLRSSTLDVSPWSLLEDTVIVSRLSFDGVTLRLEGGPSGTNYQPILDHLGSGSAAGSSSESGGAEKGFVIRELIITDVTASLGLTPAVEGVGPYQAQVPEIRLQDVGSESDGGVLLPELTRVVLTEILEAVAVNRGDIPAQFARSLRGKLAALPSGPEDVLDSAGKIIEGDPDALSKGLGRLLGGKPSGD